VRGQKRVVFGTELNQTKAEPSLKEEPPENTGRKKGLKRGRMPKISKANWERSYVLNLPERRLHGTRGGEKG